MTDPDFLGNLNFGGCIARSTDCDGNGQDEGESDDSIASRGAQSVEETIDESPYIHHLKKDNFRNARIH